MKKNLKAFMVRVVTQAIRIIQDESHELIVKDKEHVNGVDEDYVTNGDFRAQEMYVEEIRRHFPAYGLIAEEENLIIPCTDTDHDIYFTLDPLDGTKAYRRKQSNGVGTMISLVVDGEVRAAYVGDVNTGEIFGYCDWGVETDEGDVVYRTRFGRQSILQHNPAPLKTQYALFRDAPETFPIYLQDIRILGDKGGLFKKYEVSGGSIGTFASRLWIGEVGGVLFNPGIKTPWDEAPVLGITLRLGYRFFKIVDGDATQYEQYTPQVHKKNYLKECYELVIHESHIPELRVWL